MPYYSIGRSEEHTSELQSHDNLVCRLLLEKKETLGRRRTWPPRRVHLATRTTQRWHARAAYQDYRGRRRGVWRESFVCVGVILLLRAPPGPPHRPREAEARPP